MADSTLIEWTATVLPDGTRLPGSTFNMWRGCTKVSGGCKNCYAETLSGRNPGTLGVWGPKGRRIVASEAYWRHPVRWNKEAGAAGVRRKVFCASLADVFEGRDTMPEQDWEAVDAARERLWELIEATPHLDWLLLTKRPENVRRMVPPVWWGQQFPANVWLGTSVEDQAAADERIPHLLQAPVTVRFLSCEPLLGPVDLTRVGETDSYDFSHRIALDALAGGKWQARRGSESWVQVAGGPRIDWVIVGGESGPGARPMHPDWARSLRDQCQAAGVPFFFKQYGNWLPKSQLESLDYYPRNAEPQVIKNWFSMFNTSFHTTEAALTGKYYWPDGDHSFRVGKKDAGRVLDGRVWDEMPQSLGEGRDNEPV